MPSSSGQIALRLELTITGEDCDVTNPGLILAALSAARAELGDGIEREAPSMLTYGDRTSLRVNRLVIPVLRPIRATYAPAHEPGPEPPNIGEAEINGELSMQRTRVGGSGGTSSQNGGPVIDPSMRYADGEMTLSQERSYARMRGFHSSWWAPVVSGDGEACRCIFCRRARRDHPGMEHRVERGCVCEWCRFGRRHLGEIPQDQPAQDAISEPRRSATSAEQTITLAIPDMPQTANPHESVTMNMRVLDEQVRAARITTQRAMVARERARIERAQRAAEPAASLSPSDRGNARSGQAPQPIEGEGLIPGDVIAPPPTTDRPRNPQPRPRRDR